MKVRYGGSHGHHLLFPPLSSFLQCFSPSSDLFDSLFLTFLHSLPLCLEIPYLFMALLFPIDVHKIMSIYLHPSKSRISSSKTKKRNMIWCFGQKHYSRKKYQKINHILQTLLHFFYFCLGSRCTNTSKEGLCEQSVTTHS